MLEATDKGSVVVHTAHEIDAAILEYLIWELGRQDDGTFVETGITAELIERFLTNTLERFGSDVLLDSVSRYEADRSIKRVMIRGHASRLFPSFYESAKTPLRCCCCNVISKHSGARYRHRFYTPLRGAPQHIRVPLCNKCNERPVVRFRQHDCYADWPVLEVEI